MRQRLCCCASERGGGGGIFDIAEKIFGGPAEVTLWVPKNSNRTLGEFVRYGDIADMISQGLRSSPRGNRGADGVPGVLVNGNDALAVYAAAKTAVERARRGEGPTLIECDTYRFRGHHEGDEQSYRTKEEVEHAKTNNFCIRRMQKLL